jgi:tRNA1Val (adenine37-N6)-methyltransferase
MSIFNFRDFSIRQTKAALKVGTDAMVLGALIKTENKRFGLDIGTGTGVLSLMLAQKNRHLQIDAIEMHTGSVDDARFNVQNSSFSSQLNVIHQDFLEFKPTVKYDLIFTNPPFYTDALLGQKEVLNTAKHVNTLTLQPLFESVVRNLRKEGSFWMIWPIEQKPKLIACASSNGFFIKSVYTIYGKVNSALRVIVEFSLIESELEQFELTIRKEDGSYTQEYIALTKDYHDRAL